MVVLKPRDVRGHVPRPALAVVLGVALLGVLGGCTWVRLTDAGDAVVVLEQAPADCVRVGRVTSASKETVAGIGRNADRLGDEVEILARNEAATMGANTIVPTSVIEDGRRTYEAWNCPR